MNLYDEDLCLERWTLNYYFRTQRVFQEADVEATVPECVITSREYKKTALSQHQKFKNASLLIKDLAAVISEKSNDLYLQRMKNLSDLLDAYRNNEEVMIVKINNDQNDNFQDTRPNVEIIDDNDKNDENVSSDDPSGSQSFHGRRKHSSDSNSSQDEEENHKNDKIRPSIKRTRRRISSSSSSSSLPSPPLRSSFMSVNKENIELFGDISSITSKGITDNPEDTVILPSPGPSTSFATPSHTDNVSKNLKALEKIIVQPAMKQRGRPKGSKLTAIGLPSKKNTIKPFKDKPINDKLIIMLNWFVDDKTAKKSLKSNYCIEESEVEAIPSNIPSAILDNKVKINLIKKFFTSDAWKLVEEICKVKKQSNDWESPTCKKSLDTIVDEESQFKKSVGCDYCLEWYHLKCTGLKQYPRTTYWMCKSCKNVN